MLRGHHRSSRFLTFDVILKFFPELLYKSQSRHRRSIAQWAERTPHHVLGEILYVVDILLLPAVEIHTRQGLLDPVRTLAAGNTPSAAFMLVELDRPQR